MGRSSLSLIVVLGVSLACSEGPAPETRDPEPIAALPAPEEAQAPEEKPKQTSTELRASMTWTQRLKRVFTEYPVSLNRFE